MNLEAQTILLIEDNEDDVFIFRRAFKQAQLKNPVQVAQDGEEAVDYLLGRGKFADRTKHPLPVLVFLDLKLPLKNGLEVLQTLRENPDVAGICVVVLTSSAEERDVVRAHELGAQAYLVKPPPATALVEAVALLRAHLAGTPQANLPRIVGNKFEDPSLVEPGAGSE